MKKLILACSLCLSSTLFAFGPIQNGTYKGETTCTTSHGDVFSDQVAVTFSENQINWNSNGDSGPMNHTHTIVMQANGFFQMLDNGHGYVTKYGVHYQTSVNGVSGEDTFTIVNNDLALISSVEISGMRIKCEAFLEGNL